MAILLKTEKMDKKINDLIYEKQLEFKKEKQRCVSLEYTICRLLKDAYLKDEGELRGPGESLDHPTRQKVR